MYRYPRVVQVNSATSAPVSTNLGVAAGCTMATFLIRAYLRQARSDFEKTRAVVAPIRITEPGRELLVAEYGATPGKRLDALVPRMRKEQLARVAVLATTVRTEYRQTQLRKAMASNA